MKKVIMIIFVAIMFIGCFISAYAQKVDHGCLQDSLDHKYKIGCNAAGFSYSYRYPSYGDCIYDPANVLKRCYTEYVWQQELINVFDALNCSGEPYETYYYPDPFANPYTPWVIKYAWTANCWSE